jgi:hypothetical protein
VSSDFSLSDSKPDSASILTKPARTASCNGCGYCCTTEPCGLAAELLKCTTGPCVALEVESGRTFCGLVRRPVHYLLKRDVSPAVSGALSVDVAAMLGLGLGCDAADDEESAAWAWKAPAP